MEASYIHLFTLFIICISLTYAAIDPPQIKGSYHAITEISWMDEEGDNVIMYTEENFDSKSRKSSLTAFDDSMNITIYEDMNSKQSLIYDGYNCKIYKPKEWLKFHGPPDLEIYEISENRIFFPLMQLFWGLEMYKKPRTDRTFTTFRDVRAQKWSYLLNYISSDKTFNHTIEIDSFWSDENSQGPAKESVRPLGFELHRTSINLTSSKVTKNVHSINIFYFLQDVYNRKVLEPKQGIHCDGRTSNRTFPVFINFDALSFSIEYVNPSYSDFKTVDMWIDSVNKLVQVHMNPEDQVVEPNEKKQTNIIIGSNEHQVLYDIGLTSGECKLIPFKEYPSDSQTLYDFNTLSNLDLEHFFGKKIPYVYIGEVEKRGIPCRLWQATRRGWPEEAPFITTLWEWCIAERTNHPIALQRNTLPVVSLDITVIESTLTPAESMFTQGTKLAYNFYNFLYQKESYVNSVAFDITPCFTLDLIEPLMFTVPLSSSERVLFGNLTTDVDFIEAWRSIIYSTTSLERSTMRVNRVRTVIAGSNLFVEFYLLDLHPDLPSNVDDTVTLTNAKRLLEMAINTDSLSIYWGKDVPQPITLKAAKNSLRRQFDKIEPDTTIKPTAEATSETPEFTITGDIVITVPEKTSRSTKSSKSTESVSDTTSKIVTRPTPTIEVVTEQPKNKQIIYVGHSKGAMAGTSIGMLFLGISLGAGGTFAKFKYYK